VVASVAHVSAGRVQPVMPPVSACGLASVALPEMPPGSACRLASVALPEMPCLDVG